MYDVIHSTTRPVTEDIKAAAQAEVPAQVPQESAPQMSEEERRQLQLGRALRLAAASANFGVLFSCFSIVLHTHTQARKHVWLQTCL
jgi:hypothetical protein